MSATQGIWYELEAAYPLPSIDCQKSVKSVLFANHPFLLKCLNIVLRSIKYLSIAMFVCGEIGVVIGLCLPLQWSRLIAIITFWIMFVPQATTVLVMRYDMIKILLTTYELWSIVVISAASNILVAIQYNDSRAFYAAELFFSVQVIVMMDASHRGAMIVVIGSSLLLGGILLAMCLITFHWIPNFSHFIVYRRYDWTLEAEDLLLNGFMTLFALVVRNMYRRLEYRKQQIIEFHSRCTSYFVTLRFKKKDERGFDSFSPRSRSMTRVRVLRTISPLKLVPVMAPIDSLKTIARISIHPYPNAIIRIIQLCGIISASLSFVSIMFLNFPDSELKRRLDYASVITSGVYIGLSWFHSNRSILYYLWTSFDFLFSAFQFTTADMAIIYLLLPNYSFLPIITTWLWMMWIISIDALIPLMKLKLGITPAFMSYSILLQLVIHLYLVAQLVFSWTWYVPDRQMFHTPQIYGTEIYWRAIPFYFTRMLWLCPWLCRLLWRTSHMYYDPSTLLTLRGSVEYEDTELAWRLAMKQERADRLKEQSRLRSRNKNLNRTKFWWIRWLSLWSRLPTAPRRRSFSIAPLAIIPSSGSSSTSVSSASSASSPRGARRMRWSQIAPVHEEQASPPKRIFPPGKQLVGPDASLIHPH